MFFAYEQINADYFRVNDITISSTGNLEIRDAFGELIIVFPTRSSYLQESIGFTEEDKQNLLNLLTQEERNY